MRILHIGLSYNMGGAEAFVMSYYRRLVKYGIQFDFINMYQHIAYEEEIRKLGGRIFGLPNVKKSPISYAKGLRDILEEEKYSIVHIHALSAANIVPFAVAHKVGVPNIIAHAHNAQVPGMVRRMMHMANQRRLIHYATEYWTCSDAAADRLFGTGVSRQNIRHIYNAIEVDEYVFQKSARKTYREMWNVTDNTLLVGHVGRMDYIKNHPFLINVFYEIQKMQPDSRLILVGDGERREKLEQQTRGLGIEDKVLFLGMRTDIATLLSALDVFVFPSFSEGLGIAVLEAEANGLPVLASDRVPREVRLHPSCQFMSLEEDTITWAKKAMELGQLPHDDRFLATVSKSVYNITENVEAMVRVYKNLETK